MKIHAAIIRATIPNNAKEAPEREPLDPGPDLARYCVAAGQKGDGSWKGLQGMPRPAIRLVTMLFGSGAALLGPAAV